MAQFSGALKRGANGEVVEAKVVKRKIKEVRSHVVVLAPPDINPGCEIPAILQIRR